MLQDIHKAYGLRNPINRVYSTNVGEPWHVDDADAVGKLANPKPANGPSLYRIANLAAILASFRAVACNATLSSLYPEA